MNYQEKKNKYILDHASTEEDIAVLNTKLIDFILNDVGVDPRDIEILTANILLLCRGFDQSIEIVSAALAIALFMVHCQNSPVCMLEKIEPFVKKLH